MQLDSWDFKSVILLIRLENLRFKVFSVGLSTVYPISDLLVVIKAESKCCKLPLKITEKDKEEEATGI